MFNGFGGVVVSVASFQPTGLSSIPVGPVAFYETRFYVIMLPSDEDVIVRTKSGTHPG